MRDTGLQTAIQAAGGIGALAHKIGISQPSVSNWSRVPVQRIASVEAATGVPRAVLRPDLYAVPTPASARRGPHDLALEMAWFQRLADMRAEENTHDLIHAAFAEAAASLPS